MVRGARFSVGRQDDNDLQLVSLDVSRHHCELRRHANGHYTVVDLDSLHGVFVNHRPVRERRLAHSDVLLVGAWALLYLLDDSSAGAQAPVPVDGRASFLAGSTVAVEPGSRSFVDAAARGGILRDDRKARDLSVLLRLSSALAEQRTPSQLAEYVVDVLLEAFPAERAAVLQVDEGRDLRPLYQASRTSEDAQLVLQADVVDQVLADKLGVRCMRGDDSNGESEGESASRSNAGQSLLCAPLLDPDGEVLGVAYAESGADAEFDDRHLQLFGAISGIVSPALQNVLHLRWLEGEKRRLQDVQLRHDIIGESAPVRRLLHLIERVAAADSTVLIRGESGTGKELAAQAIHRSSARADGPFVAVNCATLSQSLLESDLFGHEKGAFTGATERKEGKLEVARGGTLFLDEVGEMPGHAQAKLLRVLQERVFERVGGTRPIAADVRVVAATHRDLEAAIRDGEFRQDLFYRLQVITIETPPLRRRRDDIPLLASHFLDRHGQRLGRPTTAVSPEARRYLMAYDWPGNVRELGNVIERALVLGEHDVVRVEDLPDEVLEGAGSLAPPEGFHEALAEYKKQLVLDAYRNSGGDYAATADQLGIHVNSLHRMIRRLDIKERLDA